MRSRNCKQLFMRRGVEMFTSQGFQTVFKFQLLSPCPDDDTCQPCWAAEEEARPAGGDWEGGDGEGAFKVISSSMTISSWPWSLVNTSTLEQKEQAPPRSMWCHFIIVTFLLIITITIEEHIFFSINTKTSSTKLNSTLSLSSPLCLTFMLITTISGQARIKRPTRFPEKARRSRGDGGKSSQLFYSSPMTPLL